MYETKDKMTNKLDNNQIFGVVRKKLAKKGFVPSRAETTLGIKSCMYRQIQENSMNVKRSNQIILYSLILTLYIVLGLELPQYFLSGPCVTQHDEDIRPEKSARPCSVPFSISFNVFQVDWVFFVFNTQQLMEAFLAHHSASKLSDYMWKCYRMFCWKRISCLTSRNNTRTFCVLPRTSMTSEWVLELIFSFSKGHFCENILLEIYK